MIGCYYQVFETEMGAHCNKHFTDKLHTIVGKVLRPVDIKSQLVIKKGINIESGCCLGRRDGLT